MKVRDQFEIELFLPPLEVTTPHPLMTRRPRPAASTALRRAPRDVLRHELIQRPRLLRGLRDRSPSLTDLVLLALHDERQFLGFLLARRASTRPSSTPEIPILKAPPAVR